jgi:hypothetical protein
MKDPNHKILCYHGVGLRRILTICMAKKGSIPVYMLFYTKPKQAQFITGRITPHFCFGYVRRQQAPKGFCQTVH